MQIKYSLAVQNCSVCKRELGKNNSYCRIACGVTRVAWQFVQLSPLCTASNYSEAALTACRDQTTLNKLQWNFSPPRPSHVLEKPQGHLIFVHTMS